MHQTGTLICPTGKKTFARENLSSPSDKKIPLRVDPKSNLKHEGPAPERGALRGRHERWKRDAMDAAHRWTVDVAADGEIVWSWRPDAGAKSWSAQRALWG
jgi:hypothetical protein